MLVINRTSKSISHDECRHHYSSKQNVFHICLLGSCIHAHHHQQMYMLDSSLSCIHIPVAVFDIFVCEGHALGYITQQILLFDSSLMSFLPVLPFIKAHAGPSPPLACWNVILEKCRRSLSSDIPSQWGGAAPVLYSVGISKYIKLWRQFMLQWWRCPWRKS